MVPLYRCKNRFRGSGASRRRRKELPGKTGLELESQILSRPGWSLHRAAWIRPRGGAGGTHFHCEKSRGGSSALLPPPGRTRGVVGEAPDTGSKCENEGSWKGIIHDS